ncbi:MAG TPA: toll/interleukin-1 receptor domain-containing protein, partial [Xanthobacteraceae bacterium]|nr:toll/interleukin-1 receptor domain-containing protein [Xanthobacteraceae bacterium]
MAFDVFISYPHRDKATADAVCAKLEAEGIRYWIAPRDVPPGAEWAASIVDAIDHCRAMVLIFSSSTNESKQIHREVQQAFDAEKPVVPLRIENVTPEKSLRYYMGSVHWPLLP